MSEAAPAGLTTPRPALWILVFAGPALRSSLLGCLLVAEGAIATAFDLSVEALTILFEGAIFGGLLAVLLMPPLVASIGIRRISLGAAAFTVLSLAGSLLIAPFVSGTSQAATAGLFFIVMVLGFFVAVLSPITQTLLNVATGAGGPARRSLQSVWSAGQPTGFIVASVAGGVLVEQFGWWGALLVPLAFAAVLALVLLDRNIAHLSGQDQSTVAPSSIDVAWIVLALIAFEVWSTWGSLRSWLSPGVLAALIAMVVISTVAVGRLRQAQHPALLLTPFSVAGFAAATIILFIYQLPTTAEFEVLLLDELVHMSAADIGSRTALGNFAQIAGTALAAGLLLRHQIRLALVAGFVLTIIGLAGYTLYPWWNAFAFTAWTRAIAGIGNGLLTPTLFVIALHLVPTSLQVAAGTWLVLAMIGGTEVGLALFNMVLKFASALTSSALDSYLAVEFAQLAVGMATAILAAWLMMRGALPVAWPQDSRPGKDAAPADIGS